MSSAFGDSLYGVTLLAWFLLAHTHIIYTHYISTQINAIVTDLMGEGHDAYHPVKRTGSYESQKEAAAPMIKQFQEERLPKY